ncbi:MAG: response regulator transcription factor [Bacillota bacterium]|nr:response regulator transcription factor [Bacillota bacterium]
MKIKVMIVDDQRLMRDGLKTILDLEKDISVIHLAENGKDALDKIPLEAPDVVLMDIRMPIMNGVECTLAIKEKYPQIKVLILTTFDDDEYIIDALRNGAVGYILKDLSSEKLVNCIRDVYAGNSIMQPEIAAKVISMITNNKIVTEANGSVLKHTGIDEFTEREIAVLKLVGKGLSNLEIAKKLYITEGTVKNYISSLYSKTDTSERSKLIMFALENKYV